MLLFPPWRPEGVRLLHGWQPPSLKSEVNGEVPSACILSTGHQGATPGLIV